MSTFDSLDETFDITPNKGVEIMKPTRKQKADIVISNKSEDLEKDYQYARGQIYDLVEKMAEAVDGAMDVAAEASHPRAWEVALNGAKAAAEVVEKLGDLHKKMGDMSQERTKANPQATQMGGTQQNIFVTGSTAELMKALKEANKESK